MPYVSSSSLNWQTKINHSTLNITGRKEIPRFVGTNLCLWFMTLTKHVLSAKENTKEKKIGSTASYVNNGSIKLALKKKI